MKKFAYSKNYFIYGILILLLEIFLVSYLEAWYFKSLLLILAGFSAYGLIKDYFSYFIVDEQKITYVRLSTHTEINWDDIAHIGLPHSQILKLFQMAIYSTEGKVLMVTFWFENYKELAHYIIDNCKTNPDIQIDDRLTALLE